MRPSAILGSVALALVALLLVLWRPSSTPGTAARSAQGPALPGAPGTRTAGVTEVGAAAPQADPPGAPRRDELARTPESQPRCRIRVVHAATQAPLPDARVWLQREDLRYDDAEWRQAMRRHNDGGLALAEGLGRELALDERGIVLVPRPPRALLVAAAHGALHADALLEPDAGECVLELQPGTSVEFEVVDAAGRPVAGACIALYWGEFDPLEDDWQCWSDAHGRARLPRLERQLWLEEYRGPIRATLAAGVECEPESVSFTLDSAPTEPIRFVARDFGRVLVQLTDAAGRELALEGTCSVDFMHDPDQVPTLAQRAGASLYKAPMDAGRVALGCVGLGLTLDVGITASGHDTEWREARGPTVAGEAVRVLVPVGGAWPRARGRVRGIDACFGAGRTCSLLARPQGLRGSFQTLVEEGRAFEDWVPGASELGDLGVPWTLELSRNDHPSVRATVVPEIDEASNLVDFGEVVFEPLPELARVRVLDEAGAPVKRVSVTIDWEWGTSRQGCDGTGLCVLAGSPSELPVRVQAWNPAYLRTDPVQVVAAASETVLVLRRGAALEGSLALPRGADPFDFELELHVQPSTPREVGELETELVEGGRFRFGPCEPGRARLVVVYRRLEVLERADLELTAGQTTVLEPLDLRPLLHPFALTFELAGGEPWRGGHLELRELDGGLSTWTEIGRSGRASFLAPRASVDLWVAARGARATLFEGVRDGERLVLEAAPSVRLRLPAEVRRPDSPFELLVRGTLTSEVEFEIYEEVDAEEALVGADGTTWLRLPWTGEYELTWLVRHAGTGVEHEVAQDELQTVEASAGGDVPVIEARLTRAELELALLEAGE